MIGQISPAPRALNILFKCFGRSIAMYFILLRTSEIPDHQNVFIQLSLPIQVQFRHLLQRRASLKSQRTQEQREGFSLFVYNSSLRDPPGVEKRIIYSLVRSEQ